jgi:hypothetical protein
VEWHGSSRYEIGGVRFESTEKNDYETSDNSPAASRFLGEDSDRIRLPDRNIYLLTTVNIRSEEKSFEVIFVRQVYLNDKLLRRKEWQETIPRQGQ